MQLNQEIINYAVTKKLIKKKQRAAILADCERLHMTVEEYLVNKDICTAAQINDAMGEFFCLPHCEMDMFEPDTELIEKFSYAFMRKHKLVPVSIDDNGVLLLAVGRPLSFDAMSAIATFHTGTFDTVLVPPNQVNTYIDSISAVESTSAALSELEKESGIDHVEEEPEQDVINAPSVRLVDSIIKEAIPFRTSDIHIEPFEKIVRVRYRIDGDLQDRAEFLIESYPAICARLKILAGLNIAERRIPQDGRINLNINGTEYDFRVSTLPTVYGEKFVIRILDKTAFRFTRTELGFTPEENSTIDKILAHPYGIVLITGPTGCGKSTTLYSFLKELNRPEVNIVTVEDPVEYTLQGINQTQVNAKANMTFASALRSILRQDPNIIMIGEVRDEETAQIAIRAAITGHLVFSTLHTNDAPGSVSRLMDMGVQPYLVADSLVGVISQRLVKRLCPVCKKKGKTNPREMEILGLDQPINICRPQGCQFCNNTGYKGRIAVHEVMYLSDELREMITKRMSHEEISAQAEKDGMVTLFNACRNYVLKGITSIAELLSIADD